MSTTTKHLLTAAATVAFAIAATATTVTNAFAQTAATPAATTAAATTTAAQNSVANSALASVKVQAAGKTRAEVQAEFLEARKNGTLLETEADFDVAQTRKHNAK
ncbi:DUF4148 domain-containing protein [Duganella sp. FT135W]|uniref:DUF4148 domain-containing protein n=1 Tax=Duganella flavida TaxID=2692175 RepID=A0A6L8KG04_9BURK|nr:DUF4148 domain-containing protein [Duganella flavida]MYM26349.1 DUF4148 domain-containing protein [Duganella flavida]